MLIHLVDDEPSVQDVLACILARAGYTVICTGTGADAIALFDRQPADMVLLDVTLSDADGVQLCAYLKRNPATASVPVVLLTGCDTPELRTSAQVAGASAVLGKPFQLGELLACVAEQLARAKAHLNSTNTPSP